MWGYVFVGVIAGLFLALFMLLFIFSFSPTIASLVDQVVVSFLKDVVGPVSAGFGGAVAGAYAAFYFQKKSQSDKDFQDSARTLSLARLNYVQMLNDLTSIKKESFLPYKEHAVRFVMITDLPERPVTEQALDTKLLDMLMAKKAGDTISNVLLATKKYEACFHNFKARNKVFEGYRSIVNAAHTGQGFTANFKEICKVVEPGRMLALYSNTEDIIKFVDDTIEFILKTAQDVGEVLGPQFKARGVSVIDIALPRSLELERMPEPHHTVETLAEILRRVRPELS